MVLNVLPADIPPPWEWGQKVKNQLFQNMVMLHIIKKGITNALTYLAHISLYPHPPQG